MSAGRHTARPSMPLTIAWKPLKSSSTKWSIGTPVIACTAATEQAAPELSAAFTMP